MEQNLKCEVNVLVNRELTMADKQLLILVLNGAVSEVLGEAKIASSVTLFDGS